MNAQLDRNVVWKAEDDAQRVADEAAKQRQVEADAAAILARMPPRQDTQQNPPPPPPGPPVPPPPDVPLIADLNATWAESDRQAAAAKAAALAKTAPGKRR